MLISPNTPCDYKELIDAYQNKHNIDIEKLTCELFDIDLNINNKHNEWHFILKSIVSLNIFEYNQLITYDIDSRIIFLYKILIYDYIDLLNAYSSMIGLQLFSVARSLCEHSRIFLSCQCDEDFLNYYFSEYSEDEKKERYYKKRESNITKKLNDIANEAKNKNSESDFYVESLLYNLSTDLYSNLSDKLGELSHLSEITFTRKLISFDSQNLFPVKYTDTFYCTIDDIIEYLTSTTLVTTMFFISESIYQNESSIQLFNFLRYINDNLFRIRHANIVLSELKKKLITDFEQTSQTSN